MKKYISLVTLGIFISLLIVPALVSVQAAEQVDVERTLSIIKIWRFIAGIIIFIGAVVALVGAVRYIMAGKDKKKVAAANRVLIAGAIIAFIALMAYGIAGLTQSCC